MEDFETKLPHIRTTLSQAMKEAFPNNPELVDNFAGMFQVLQTINLPDDRASRELGLSFLTEAQRDLRSCEILYRKKSYPHAVYHLQQAVEKATKGVLLGLGFYKASELRDLFGHLTPQLFIKALFDRTGLTNWAETLTDETLKGKIGKAKETISEEEKRVALAHVSRAEINRLLALIEEYHEISRRLTASLASEVSNLVGTGFSIPLLWRVLPSVARVFGFGVVTFPHEAYTRYPDGKMTPSDYNSELGMVSATGEIAKCLRSEINRLKIIIRP